MQRAEHVIDGCWGQTDRQIDRQIFVCTFLMFYIYGLSIYQSIINTWCDLFISILMCRAIWPCRDCVQEALEDSLSEERCEFFGPTFRDHMERHMCHLHLYTCTITPLHLHICKCKGVDAFACNYTFVFLTVEDADDDDKEKLNDQDNDDGFDDNEDDDEYEYMSLNMNMNLCIYVCVLMYIYIYTYIYIYEPLFGRNPSQVFDHFFRNQFPSSSNLAQVGPFGGLWSAASCDYFGSASCWPSPCNVAMHEHQAGCGGELGWSNMSREVSKNHGFQYQYDLMTWMIWGTFQKLPFNEDVREQWRFECFLRS